MLSVTLFLVFSADVTAVDNFQWTALHHACHRMYSTQSGCTCISLYLIVCLQMNAVRKIVEAGADLNAQSINGGTPIMRAVESSQTEIVQYLLEKG